MLLLSERIIKKQNALDELNLQYEQTNQRPVMRTRKCASIDAITYYEERIRALNEEYNELSVKPEVPVGVAFVTFPKGSIIDDRIRADFAYTPLIMPSNKSSIGSNMDIRWWATNNAPYPNDILWKNLSRKGAQLKFHSFLDLRTDHKWESTSMWDSHIGRTCSMQHT